MVVYTGAGVSKESGIPTFRDPETGLWAKYDPMELATEEAFLRRPEFVWDWYEHRFGIVASAEPNPGHLAIAELETLLPRVVVVTQNVDGLHQRAGSTHVIELHGTMHTFRCMSGRHRGYTRDDLSGQTQRPPRCPDGELFRPEVVWFGESLPEDALARRSGWRRAATWCSWSAPRASSTQRPLSRSSRARRARSSSTSIPRGTSSPGAPTCTCAGPAARCSRSSSPPCGSGSAPLARPETRGGAADDLPHTPLPGLGALRLEHPVHVLAAV